MMVMCHLSGYPEGMPSTEFSERDWALWRAFTLMSRQLTSTIEQRLRDDAGISNPDFEILYALSQQEGHQARARDLGEMLTWEKSRISHQVKRMVERSLVERTECETDLRGTWVALAPAGREALEAALPGYRDQLRQSFTGLLDSSQAVSFAQSALKVIEATDPQTCRVEIDRIERDVGVSSSLTN
ncbi:MAG: MarR family transcriptional regulator [Actinobacteria bacterium HGW-Actinobacteria-4]|nr:MAG: MarR family transcriptional regulator [Actinobacteria bacterium HGW-Actinobacteria-4]